MPRKQRLRSGAPRNFEYRGHWLSKHTGSDAWCVTWYDGDARQTRRASLGTADDEEAKERLIAYVDERRRLSITAPNQVLIAQVVQRYVGGHGQHVARIDTIQWSLNHWLDFFEVATVADITPGRVRDFIAALKKRGLSDASVRRVIADGKAALNWVRNEGELDSVPPIKLPPMGEARQRVASIDEVVLLLRFAPVHLQIYLWIALGTGARPTAILELTHEQIDFVAGTIELNPHGRTQNKKRRPTVPIAPTLRTVLTSAPKGLVVQFRGKPVRDISTVMRHVQAKIAKEMAIEAARRARQLRAEGHRSEAKSLIANARTRIRRIKEIFPYVLRHTFGFELSERGVPLEQIAGFMGHTPSLRMTAAYARKAHSNLTAAVTAVEVYLREIRQRLLIGGTPILTEGEPARTPNQGGLLTELRT